MKKTLIVAVAAMLASLLVGCDPAPATPTTGDTATQPSPSSVLGHAQAVANDSQKASSNVKTDSTK